MFETREFSITEILSMLSRNIQYIIAYLPIFFIFYLSESMLGIYIINFLCMHISYYFYILYQSVKTLNNTVIIFSKVKLNVNLFKYLMFYISFL